MTEPAVNFSSAQVLEEQSPYAPPLQNPLPRAVTRRNYYELLDGTWNLGETFSVSMQTLLMVGAAGVLGLMFYLFFEFGMRNNRHRYLSRFQHCGYPLIFGPLPDAPYRRQPQLFEYLAASDPFSIVADHNTTSITSESSRPPIAG